MQNLDGVAVVIPCFRCAQTIALVIDGIPSDIQQIICVDDASEDRTLSILTSIATEDERVTVIRHTDNQGVGAATVSGYREALRIGAKVIVKLDSDGQMNPKFISDIVAPILAGQSDYVKGNRFFDIDEVRKMPALRLIGNAGLTFLSRFSSGYWHLSDPTNGYTAIESSVASLLPFAKLNKRYFFESDVLFRLSTFGAVITEQPIETQYGAEKSHLSELHSFLTFPASHLRNFFKRIFYNYFLRNFDLASLNLIFGTGLTIFGLAFGLSKWLSSAATGAPATAGTVLLSVTPTLIGFQMLLAFLQHDVARQPTKPIHHRIRNLTTLTTLSKLQRITDEHEASSTGSPKV